jgi:hypothetical protein
LQALTSIQNVFEQVITRSNVASIETVLDLLREHDATYRVGMELTQTFKEKAEHTKPLEKVKLSPKNGSSGIYGSHKTLRHIIKETHQKKSKSYSTSFFEIASTVWVRSCIDACQIDI